MQSVRWITTLQLAFVCLVLPEIHSLRAMNHLHHQVNIYPLESLSEETLGAREDHYPEILYKIQESFQCYFFQIFWVLGLSLPSAHNLRPNPYTQDLFSRLKNLNGLNDKRLSIRTTGTTQPMRTISMWSLQSVSRNQRSCCLLLSDQLHWFTAQL